MTVALDFDSTITRGSSAGGPAVFRRRGRIEIAVPPAAPSCAVLSGDAALGRRLSAAAELAGWEVEGPPSNGPSALPVPGSDCRLLVVDLTSPPACRPGELESFVREFAARSGTLLVVCGASGSIEHEAWARSMGAFVHVPGVAAGDSLVSWFSEARIVAERRRPAPPRPSAHRPIAVVA